MNAPGRRSPRSGEFFAPLPLAALALMVVNDAYLKAAFHSAVTGKLSDIAVCFFMPLFLSELLGIFFGATPRLRLAIGGLVTGALFAALEVVAPVTALALNLLGELGPRVGIMRPFRMTSDGTDLFCLLLIPAALAYGRRRLADYPTSVPSPVKG
jgi:hypothetical protein